MTDKIPKTFMLDIPTWQHVQDVARKMQSSDSYAIRRIILEHMMMEEAARANNIAGQLATPTPQ